MEPVLPLTEHIERLRRNTHDCVNSLSSAKLLHARFLAKKSGAVLMQINTASESLESLFKGVLQGQEPTAVARSLPHIVQIYLDLHTSKRIATLLNTVESDSSDELYSTLEDAVNTVIAMTDSTKTRDEKFQIINRLCTESSLELADSSPRRMGVLLLELMKFALVTLHDDHPSVQELHKRLETRIGDRRLLFGNSTPRYESALNLQVVSTVHEEETQELTRKAAICKKPITFWSQFSRSTRFISHFRSLSACERYGDSMQQALGAAIGGLAIKLNREFQRVIQGKVTPGQNKEFGHKIDIYIAVYKALKENLKTMRKELFTIAPDNALLALLRYSSELRLALSEIGLRLDILKKHSSTSCLQVFQAVKLVTKQRPSIKATELAKTALQDDTLPNGVRSIAESVLAANPR